MGEHGGWQHDQSLYEELIHVPLVMRLPGGESAGSEEDEVVSLVDLLPTLLSLLEIEGPAGMAGRDLLAGSDGAGAAGPRLVSVRLNRKKFFRPWFEQRGDRNLALRQGDLKGILNADRGTLEVYRLSDDPAEARDLAEELPGVAAEMRALAEAHLKGVVLQPVAAPLEADAETLEDLAELGYVDDEDDED